MPVRTVVAHQLPAEATGALVLGNFLTYFDVAGVALTCLHQGQLYHFAQWRTQWGKIMALGQCRYLAPAQYEQLWLAAPTGGPVSATGIPAQLTGLTDEQVLRRFFRLIACDAAVLQYNATNTDSQAFWQWRNATGQAWIKQVATRRLFDSHQPLWNEVPWKGQAICPATFAEVIRLTGQDSRNATAARAVRYKWSAEQVEELNLRHSAGR
ncbi:MULTISPECIES: hypothetical protein [Hymenobacter]|uniref:Uncharacterized protein n=1 Tax=Hymenobacter guriensis TaxID=2793065 RepID=A0ABS0L4A4_9BACT|nr:MULTISPECIES: hypothetical protein [Hymenobacter]MBG8554964.1 hypothetical protein [Hymenobacter guriensis]MCR5890434.1 hypothetical protein [Hymenobacter sp. J193]